MEAGLSLLAIPLRALAALLAFVAMLLAFGMFCCDGAADFVEGK